MTAGDTWTVHISHSGTKIVLEKIKLPFVKSILLQDKRRTWPKLFLDSALEYIVKIHGTPEPSLCRTFTAILLKS